VLIRSAANVQWSVCTVWYGQHIDNVEHFSHRFFIPLSLLLGVSSS
jgi:hypothetical protein